MTTLFIIESPGKKATLEAILGPEFVVRASFGHIRDLPKDSDGISGPEYKPHYVIPDTRTKATVAALRKEAANANRVLIATDPDREGEAIAWHIADELNLKTVERVTYQEITRTAVLEAVSRPRPLDLALVHAQEARRGLDRLIGWKASKALSNKLGTTLSAGRVQSPAVRMVVDRENAIRAFKRTDHFGVTLSIDGEAGQWTAAWKPVLSKDCPYQLDRELAVAVAKTTALRVVTFADTELKRAPPPPFITSTLQRAAQSALKLKPKAAMEVAQKLYEQGAITYMRTDTPNISEDGYAQIAAYANANNLPIHSVRRTWKSKSGAQEAHEAIRPSYIATEEAGTTDQERALYRLIWKRAVASQLADAVYAVRSVTLEDHKGGHAFAGQGRSITTKGWLSAGAEESDTETQETDDADPKANPIPPLTVGQNIEVAKGVVTDKRTKAPARYTLATLGAALESNGIGRPATYASILDGITTRREYVIEDKAGFLSPALVAERIVSTLVGAFRFADLDYTRELETELDEIAAGRRTFLAVVSAADRILDRELASVGPGTVHPCPECGEPLRRRSWKDRTFWGCSAYPKCTASMDDQAGTPVARKAVAVSAHQCPDCSSPLRHLSKSKKDDPKKKGYDFWSCTGSPKCRRTFNTDRKGAPVLT